ncbi:CHAT domain-containing protein [Vulcanococcus limneticus]|uniref:CHAT domain-containing protein n=1 Tax=Vulcanococcus limneticus TaxID=2170428 RepID=UPI00398BFC7B
MAPSARPDAIPPQRLGRRLFTLVVCGLAAPASAQVVGGGLNTRVNGSDGGSCQAGTCRVDGGIGAGPNGFYRFRQFDTRQGVDGVTIDNRGRTNVVVGVTSPQGSFLNKPLALSEAANLFWLSPGGIWLGRGASFSPVNTLLLSTATSLNLGQGKGFDALRTTAEQAAGLNGIPDPSQPAIVSMGTLNDLGLTAPGPVVLAGGRLQVDRSLLIQAPLSALQAVAGAGSSLQAGDEVSLQAQRLNLSDLQISTGSPGQRGLVTLRTLTPAGEREGGIALADSTLQGHVVQVVGGSVDLTNSAIEAPKGLIRLQSTAPEGGIQLSNSRLDLEAHSLAELSAPASRILGGATYTITPLIHLQASGDLSIRDGSQLNASQDLSVVRQALASRGEPPLDPAAISLVSTSGNVVLESERAVRIAHSSLRADASDNLSGNIGIVARGAAEGIQVDASTLSARGGAGSGDIRLSSASGIGIRASQLLTESGRAPSSDGITADWDSWLPFTFSGGEITLLNTSATRPISVESSRLEALTHTREGALQPFRFDATTGATFQLDDVHDVGDAMAVFTTDNSGNPIGVFPQGRLVLVSDGGIQISNRSQLDAGSHPQADPANLEAFGGRITLLNRSTGAPLEVLDSSLLNRSDPSTALTFSPFDPSQPLLLGRPGQLELWSAGGLAIRGSQVDGGQDSTVALASLTPADLQGSSLVRGAGAPLEGINPRSGQTALLDPPSTGGPEGPISAQDPVLGRLIEDSRTVRVQAAVQVVFTTAPVPTDPLVITVQRVNPLDPQPPPPPIINPTPQELETVLGKEGAAPIVALLSPPPTLSSSLTPRKLPPDPLPSTATSPAPPASPIENGSNAVSLVAPSSPIKNASSKVDLQPSGSRGTALASVGDTSRQASLDAATAALDFSQSEQRSQRTTLEGLGLASAPGAGQTPTTSWLQEQMRAMGTSLELRLGRPYRPAIVRLSLTPGSRGDATLDLLYLPPQGDVQGWRLDVPEVRLRSLIARLQEQLSRMEQPDLEAPGTASAQLSQLLLQPLLPALRKDGINALLLSVDRGLQAIPYAALPVAPGVLLGDAYALTLTPSLGLTNLAATAGMPVPGRMLLGGSSRFPNGLADLPLVRQELQTLAAENSSDLLLDSGFSERSLLLAAGSTNYRRVHLATHAEFRGGRQTVARLYTSSGELNLSDLARSLREGPSRGGLDLLSLSACRTALGDEQSELGLVGLALRTGSRSALGTLWFVDDAVSAAFFVEFYRQLGRGLPKDEALRVTRLAFRQGTIRLQDDRIVDAQAKTLVAGLSPGDRLRLAEGLSHPYFWAGMTLSGSPW